MVRVRKSGGGMKSASKTATNSPVAVFRPSCKRPGLISFAIGAVQVLDRESERLIFLDQSLGKRVSVVGGIVQYLNLQQVASGIPCA